MKVDTQLFRGVHCEIIAYDDLGNEWMIHSTRKYIGRSYRARLWDSEDIHVMRLNETEENLMHGSKKYVEVEEQEAGLINAIVGRKEMENSLIYLSPYFLWIFLFVLL